MYAVVYACIRPGRLGMKEKKSELDKIEESWNGIGAPPIKTKELEFMIKSVKGIRDPLQIKNFIENLLKRIQVNVAFLV